MNTKQIEQILDEYSILCPDCDNSGTRVGGNEQTGPEPEQCQFCYEYPRSRFRFKSDLLKILKEGMRESWEIAYTSGELSALIKDYENNFEAWWSTLKIKTQLKG